MMKISSNRTTNYSTSSQERQALDLLRQAGKPVFTAKDLRRLANWTPTKTNNTLQTLKRKGHVTGIRKNLHAITDEIPANALAIATQAHAPAYASYWTALSHHGLTEQQPATIQVITTKRPATTTAGPLTIEATHTKKERFYGYTTKDDAAIAEPEKALIDALARPEKAGGLKEVTACLKRALHSMDKKTFTTYLKRYRSTTLNARTGHLYQRLTGTTLKLPIPTTYVKLDPERPRTGKRDPYWMLDLNEDAP